MSDDELEGSKRGEFGEQIETKPESPKSKPTGSRKLI